MTQIDRRNYELALLAKLVKESNRPSPYWKSYKPQQREHEMRYTDGKGSHYRAG